MKKKSDIFTFIISRLFCVLFASYRPMGKSSGLTCRLVLRTFQRDLIHICTPILLQMVQFRVNAIYALQVCILFYIHLIKDFPLLPRSCNNCDILLFWDLRGNQYIFRTLKYQGFQNMSTAKNIPLRLYIYIYIG